MLNSVYTKLKALCHDSDSSCDSTKTADIHDIPTVVDGGVEYETLSFTIQDSHYNSVPELEQMLAASVATWQQATKKSCSTITFEAEPDMIGSGCGASPVKRSVPQRNESLIAARTPVCIECTPVQEHCKYEAMICAGPDHINPVLAGAAGAYSNHMNIQLSWALDGHSAFDEFICEAIVDGLTALATAIAPEIEAADIPEEVKFQTMCEEMGNSHE